MNSKSFSNLSRKTRLGFTIIELLVAVGITALLVSLMLTIVTNVLNGWNRSSGSLGSGNQARTILTQLSQDLQSLIVKQDGNVWLAATVPSSPLANGSDWNAAGTIKPAGSGSLNLPAPGSTAPWPDLTTYRFGQAGTWLRFFTVRPDSNLSTDTISAPRAVSYQIVRRQVGTSFTYQFYRAEARPGPAGTDTNCTFNSGYNTADTVLGHVGNILKPASSQLLANNVIDFGVRVWTADPTANPPVFPNTTSNNGFAATTTITGAGAFSPLGDGPTMTYGFPVVIEVMVRILTDDGARQIASLEAGNITGDWWTIALANSNVYTRRIDIKAQAF